MYFCSMFVFNFLFLYKILHSLIDFIRQRYNFKFRFSTEYKHFEDLLSLMILHIHPNRNGPKYLVVQTMTNDSFSITEYICSQSFNVREECDAILLTNFEKYGRLLGNNYKCRNKTSICHLFRSWLIF